MTRSEVRGEPAAATVSQAPAIGLVFLGRRPRSVFTGLFADVDPRCGVVVRCALADVPDAEVAALHDPGGDYPVHVPVAPDLLVDIPRAAIAPYVQRCVDALARDGARLVAVLCAADLGVHSTVVPVVEPGRLLAAVVQSVVGPGPVGILVPTPGQVDGCAANWAARGLQPDVRAVSPYAPSAGERLREAAEHFRAAGVQAVALECMGFDSGHARTVGSHSGGAPVFVARELAGSVVTAMSFALPG